MRRLVIVRHGDTFAPGEPPRRIGARTDLALTANGEAQAVRLGGSFQRDGFVFERALTGPLARARRTAGLLLAEMVEAPAPAIDPMLDEIDHGPDEDRVEAEVRARIGQAALDRWDREALAPEGWQVDRPARLAWWRELLDRPGGGDTLLVTSNGAARFALLALAEPGVFASLKLRTGAWGMLAHDAAAGWSVAAWDRRPDEHG